MINYYETLEINDKKCSQEIIKKSYKNLALKWHPDRNLNNLEEAKKKFFLISEAYQILGDEEKRKFYDIKESFDFVFKKPEDIFDSFFNKEIINIGNETIKEFIFEKDTKDTILHLLRKKLIIPNKLRKKLMKISDNFDINYLTTIKKQFDKFINNN